MIFNNARTHCISCTIL